MSDVEIYYELIFVISSVLLGSAITAAAYAYFCMPFVENKKHAIAVGAAYFIMIMIMRELPIMFSNFVAYGSSVLAGLITMCVLDKKRILQKSFLAVIFFTERWIVMAISNCFDIWIEKSAIIILGYQQSELTQLWFFALECIIDNLVCIPMFFGIAWIIQKAYKYNTEDMTIKEFLLMILPSMSGLVGYAMLKLYNQMYLNDTGRTLVEVSNKFNAMSLFYYFISICTIVVYIVLFQNIKEKQEEMRQNELLSNQIENMKQHISEVEKLYRDIRGIRHDMGNHIMTLEALYASGEHEAADEYMEELKCKLTDTNNEIRSGNPVTDVILLERRREAEEKKIEFICDFHYPNKGQLQINAFDISVILNNALDNAIKAAYSVQQSKGKAKITITTYTKNSIYILKIENSFEGSPNIHNSGQTPLTNKQKDQHGYGLRNIKKVAQKYCGDIYIDYNESTFKLSVMLVQ